jgi:hypothetical protein
MASSIARVSSQLWAERADQPVDPGRVSRSTSRRFFDACCRLTDNARLTTPMRCCVLPCFRFWIADLEWPLTEGRLRRRPGFLADAAA